MTDPWQETAPMTSSQRPRGFSPGTIALLATATVMLAVAGLAIGWYVAGTGAEPQAQASASPSAAAASPSPSPSPSELPSPTPEPSPSATGGGFQAMPDVLTRPFREARLEIMAKFGVSVKVEFDQASTASAESVLSTVPAAGQPVLRGTSVTIVVAGPRVRFPMPDVVGQSCSAAQKKLVEQGLRIGRYLNGRSGTVLAVSVPKDQEVGWNDAVDLTCGVAESPSPAAG
ncbi:PASTA domain-containing protein [Catellatospora bangladeshensis]|uniref:PASTA domain-containing protein n=1 Tax=Catellatospora bangladeshensis TaxID=310355 RepID=A0A8J3JID6_9ACTN|nr:PASTA domain-containing protein [Catellatospora bangladeshensis]GIF81203.1 hypothetical protein Cba03nite_25520 [Catellatospora bangladeshensis]